MHAEYNRRCMIRAQANGCSLPGLHRGRQITSLPDKLTPATGKDPPEELIQCQKISRLALPYRQNLPSHGGKRIDICFVPGDILCELASPELCPGRGCSGKAAPEMPVPEASMHKHDRTVSWENEVRPARKPL